MELEVGDGETEVSPGVKLDAVRLDLSPFFHPAMRRVPG